MYSYFIEQEEIYLRRVNNKLTITINQWVFFLSIFQVKQYFKANQIQKYQFY